jgi:hypothetical protein
MNNFDQVLRHNLALRARICSKLLRMRPITTRTLDRGCGHCGRGQWCGRLECNEMMAALAARVGGAEGR